MGQVISLRGRRMGNKLNDTVSCQGSFIVQFEIAILKESVPSTFKSWWCTTCFWLYGLLVKESDARWQRFSDWNRHISSSRIRRLQWCTHTQVTSQLKVRQWYHQSLYNLQCEVANTCANPKGTIHLQALHVFSLTWLSKQKSHMKWFCSTSYFKGIMV